MAAFEQRERERELYGPKKRGPKPKTFLLKAQTKVKAKSYEFRSESVRGFSYPSPEPVVTPRAREGLRAVVPNIFPPSAVNRGESFLVQELALQQQTHLDINVPKKRGPKPKPHFQDNSSVGPESHKRKAEEDIQPETHKLPKLQSTEDMRLVKVGHRHTENHSHNHHHHHHHHSHGHNPHKQLYTQLYSHRTDTDLHQTKDYLPASFKPQSRTGSTGRPTKLPQMEKPYFLDSPSPNLFEADSDEGTWRPSLRNLENVLVTDVTSNCLTVTIRESSTSKGFFSDKR